MRRQLRLEGAASIRLTVKERILLHLMEHGKAADAFEVPRAVTQEGIAEATWIDVPHFSQYMRPMVREGFVGERTTHVKGSDRRRKVYGLTDRGKLEAFRLQERLLRERVRTKDEKGMRVETLADALKDGGASRSLLKAIHLLETRGVVDLAELVEPPTPGLVEMLTDMPVPPTFVVRKRELAEITAEGGGPRTVVIRGEPGIGKTSLAAKACELLRGKRNLFWRRLQSWDSSESLLAAMGDFLFAMGRPGVRYALSEGGLARAGPLFARDLPGTHAFLVLDDAHRATEDTLEFLRLLKDVVAKAPDVRALILTRTSVPFYDRRDVAISGTVEEIELSSLARSGTCAR